MEKSYNKQLKNFFIKQYKEKKEEYEHSLEAAKNIKNKVEDDEEIESRSGFGYNLRLESVYFDSSSRKKHRTDKFEVGDEKNLTPIYRRGQPFKMIVTFNRKYSPQHDTVFLIVSYGPNATMKNGTQCTLPLLPTNPIRNVDEWAVWIHERNGNSLTLKINTPATCHVGIWRFRYAISSPHQREDETISAENIFYILFNPWCEADEVYLREEADREAYVLTDYGNIYKGTYKNPTPKQWVYGQFDFSVLPSVFLLVERSSYPSNLRNSAVIMARALAAVINANDDFGLLIGNWGTDIADGTNPQSWIGSVGIFDEFLSRGGDQPVRYAQCWVFAGCLTTACRAIGIPCRTITCFQAAHDGVGNLSVCYYLDTYGRDIKGKPAINSIWNYHVWNEVWMERKDLPEEYNGWQAIDATPQEKSRDLFRVGPAPVKAVLHADMGLDYDIPFVFAEVNSDICYLQSVDKSNKTFKLVLRRTDAVGNLIVTDSFNHNYYPQGQGFMETLNGNYKYLEGSIMERKMFQRAVSQMPEAEKLYDSVDSDAQNNQDVHFNIKDIRSLVFGDGFDVSLTIQNSSPKVRTVELQMGAQIAIYTGSLVDIIKQENRRVVLQPKQSQQISIAVGVDDYINKLGTASHIKMTFVGTVLETDQLYATDETFEVIKPMLDVFVPEDIRLKSPFSVTFYFINPYNIELANCTLTVEAGQVQRPTVMEIGNVPVNGMMEKTVQLRAKHAGRSLIVGILKSDTISVKGSTFIEVQY